MKLLKTPALVAVTAMALALGACAGGSHTGSATAPQANASASSPASTSPPVATVNGVPISRGLFDYYVKNTVNKPAAELAPQERTALLDNLVHAELIAQQAQKEGLDQAADTAALLQLSRLQILEQAGAQHFLKDKQPTDAEIQAEYKKQIAAMPKVQYHARHILVHTRAEAVRIIRQLKHGANFAALAKKDSIDTGTRDHGGDLSWFLPNAMVKPFADAVASLKKGEITPEPVQTQYGWHVIQLLGTRPTPVPTLAQVRTRVTQLVQNEKFKDYVDQLMKTAKIKTNL